MFKEPGKEHKVIYLINESEELLDYCVGDISVLACQHTLQCIRADAVIIAVTATLEMNQSGVGRVLSITGEFWSLHFSLEEFHSLEFVYSITWQCLLSIISLVPGST